MLLLTCHLQQVYKVTDMLNYFNTTCKNKIKKTELNCATYKAVKAVQPVGFKRKIIVAPLYVSASPPMHAGLGIWTQGVTLSVQILCQKAFSNSDADDEDPKSALRCVQQYLVDCIADTLRLPLCVGDQSVEVNYTHVLRDKSVPQPKSRLPVLLETHPIAITDTAKKAVKPKPLAYTAVGFDTDVAREAEKNRKSKDATQKRARKHRQKLTKLEKLRKKYTTKKNRAAILLAIDDLDKAAQSLGAHVILVDGVRKGDKARSRIQDKATILMHQLRQVGGIPANKIAACLGTCLRVWNRVNSLQFRHRL